MSKDYKVKQTDIHRYKLVSNRKTINKLICLWSKSQSSRKQSIIFICELMRRLFGEGDLVLNVIRLATENRLNNMLVAISEFTLDLCVVEFDFMDKSIPIFIDIAFYKNKSEDIRIYDWLDSQESIVNSISFALYLFIRSFGMGDTKTIISDLMLEHKDIFMGKLNDIMKKESANE